MFGIVLWSDRASGKAVIWCDDHGDLVFYGKDEGAAEAIDLDVGDLVRFDLVETGATRTARNAQVVDEARFPNLPQRLRGAAGARLAAPRMTAGTSREGTVVPFDARRRAAPAPQRVA